MITITFVGLGSLWIILREYVLGIKERMFGFLILISWTSKDILHPEIKLKAYIDMMLLLHFQGGENKSLNRKRITPQQNGIVERRNRTLVEAARTMLTFANLPSFLWAEAIATACFTQIRSIIYKHFDKTPYELINKRKPNIKFFRVFRCRCYLLNDYEDVGKLKEKGDIGVFVGYSKESTTFRIYNKQTRKIHESVNVNFEKISEMASKQFSLEPGLSNLNETGKSSNPSVSNVDEASKKHLEDLFQDFYEVSESFQGESFESFQGETPINEEVFHEVSESFQGNLLHLH
uniref:Retrovirus-related Pol polyprotein from transposon TNT 1-94 n=1 Tax=Tanacetum cinerariifolium TaxID=118510 RepID=A0A6L2KNL3_TANCI|nr:retrovirus-related Pol polyprotein from transposon TNT 1-94 [Tanacetum cinerariifolium]